MRKFIALPVSAFLLASCSFIPTFSQPDVPVPARWSQEHVAVNGQEQQIPVKWWTLYQDDTLNGLMEEALTQNLDIRAGVERINQSRATLRVAGANLLPSANATMGAERARTNPAIGSSSTDNSLTGGLAIAYDLDLFGANRASIAAARAALHGQQYTEESLKLVILGEVANAYFNILAAQERVRIAEDNLKNSREILRIIQVRVDTGLDSDLELAQQRVAVSSSEAALATIRQQESVYKHALAVLLGRSPQDFALTTAKPVSKFDVPAVALEQPSTLLERRPDIKAVEQSLMAADANIGAARAAFFPSITLGASGSIAGTSFGDPATTILALAANAAAPIFSGGRLEGGLDNASAKQRELVETYRKTVLVAFREVEDALSSTRAANERESALKTAVNNARRAYEISRSRYEVGTIDFQTMLDTQAALLSAEDTYAQALASRLTASVDLVKSLGGGWSDGIAPAAPIAEPVTEPVAVTDPVVSTEPAAGTTQAAGEIDTEINTGVDLMGAAPHIEEQAEPIAASIDAPAAVLPSADVLTQARVQTAQSVVEPVAEAVTAAPVIPDATADVLATEAREMQATQ